MINHLKPLAILVYVVDLGSFSQAARKLKVSPSVVSQHISNFEKELGVPLLFRSTRSLTLTNEGEKIYLAGKQMLSAVNESLDSFNDSAAETLVELSLSIPAVLIDHPIFSLAMTFLDNNPGLKMTISASDNMTDLLTSRYDAAIRMGKLTDSSLKSVKVADDERVAVVAPKYYSKRKKPTCPNDLVEWDFIGFTPVPDNITFKKKGSETQSVWGKCRLYLDTTQAAKKAALAGFGIAGLPSGIIRDELEEGSLVEVLPEWSGSTLDIFIVWPHNSALSLTTRRFIDFIIDCSKNNSR